MYKFFALVFIGLAISCKHDPLFIDNAGKTPGDTIVMPPVGKPCDPDTVYFQNDILPLIVGNCGISGCHDAATASDGVVLDSYANIINTGDVKPGDPNGSDLYENIVDNDPDKRMPPPPSPALSADQKALIFKWIQQGALNNYCDGCDTSDVKFSTHVLPIFEENCQGCHGPTPVGYAQYSLTNHSEVVFGITSNNLLERIKHLSGYNAMPVSSTGVKLSDCKIRTIELWINKGMKDD